MRIALYIGNELYPTNNVIPTQQIQILQSSPLTSPILSLLNASESNQDLLVYNDSSNPMYNSSGAYVGPSNFAATVAQLRSSSIQEVYLSFSTSGTDWMGELLASDPGAVASIFLHLKNTLGLDGVDFDYEEIPDSTSNLYPISLAAIQAGLKVTAAPYLSPSLWSAWVSYAQSKGGTVSWLNLQCYAGGKGNNPGDWLSIGVPIVAGSCKRCQNPLTVCSPADMQALFNLWRTGEGKVSTDCWSGVPNTQPQAIGGGFIWAYSAISGSSFMSYMNALKVGLGM